MRRATPLILATAVGVVAATGCGSGGAAETGARGSQVYSRLGCGGCHGADRAGMPAAPPLQGLEAHWNADELVEYLRDPAAVRAQRPRLQYRAEQYSLDMPGYPDAPQEDLAALAEFLLSG